MELISIQQKRFKKPCSTACACMAEKDKVTVSSSLPYPDVSFSVLLCLMRTSECQEQVNKQAHKPAHE